MKSLFLILVMVLMGEFGYGAQPLRKPFIKSNIDGKAYRSGDILTVKPGQKLLIGVEMEGGRRDYCKFPDTYADIAGTAQILSRGENGINYQINGEKADWKLLKEEFQFSADKYIQVKSSSNQPNAEITVSNEKFSQTFVKITIKTSWQFTQNGKTTQEENTAQETIYFKVAGGSDVWFSTQNIQATGINNELVGEKLNAVQSACDSIETNFFRLKFTAVQQSIRNLQSTVTTLKSIIDEVTASNSSYKTKVLFIGLPSDIPYSDISALLTIKNSWITFETMVNDQKQQLAKLPAKESKVSKDELVKIVTALADWHNKLPENTFDIIHRYLTDFKVEMIQFPSNLLSIAKEKTVTDYSQTVNDLNAFLDQRIQQIPDEIQRISSTQTRLQAVRLFDGMLRSYVSSIYWAEWKNTRE